MQLSGESLVIYGRFYKYANTIAFKFGGYPLSKSFCRQSQPKVKYSEDDLRSGIVVGLSLVVPSIEQLGF